MIVVNLCGGVGNQAFQYAFGRYLMGKYDVRFLNSCGQYGFQLDRFNARLSLVTSPIGRHISEKTLRYNPDQEIADNCTLNGYWQCESNFKNVESEIRQELTLIEPARYEAQKLNKQINEVPNSVMLHIRRGDYTTWALERHGLLPMSYYLKAANIIAESFPDVHFFVFSDDPGYARSFTLPYPMTVVYCTPHEDLWLMSKCKHAIMANSSFSWWGAWLGPDINGGTVIAPEQWFASGNEDSRDIVPERWTRLRYEEGIDNGNNGDGRVTSSGFIAKQRLRSPWNRT